MCCGVGGWMLIAAVDLRRRRGHLYGARYLCPMAPTGAALLEHLLSVRSCRVPSDSLLVRKWCCPPQQKRFPDNGLSEPGQGETLAEQSITTRGVRPRLGAAPVVAAPRRCAAQVTPAG